VAEGTIGCINSNHGLTPALTDAAKQSLYTFSFPRWSSTVPVFSLQGVKGTPAP
jgi:hypothetical protein